MLLFRLFNEIKVQIHQDLKLIGEYSLEQLRSGPRPLFIQKNQHRQRWHSTISVDQEDKPVLCLYDDNIRFENLIVAPDQQHVIFRSIRVNDFKKGNKKTTYNFVIGGQPLSIDCQYDQKNMVTALIAGKRKEVRTGMKLKDRKQYPLCLNVPEQQMKLQATLSSDASIFDLYVNGIRC